MLEFESSRIYLPLCRGELSQEGLCVVFQPVCVGPAEAGGQLVRLPPRMLGSIMLLFKS